MRIRTFLTTTSAGRLRRLRDAAAMKLARVRAILGAVTASVNWMPTEF